MTLTRLLQLCDSAFPGGGYAFSDGLETYTQSRKVRSSTDLLELLTTQLEQGWGRVDLVGCALAWYNTDSDDAPALERLNMYLNALKVVEGPRRASLKMGVTLLRSARVLWPQLEEVWLPASSHHALVFGTLAHGLGIPQRDLLKGLCSSYLLGKCTSATRLFSLGGLEAQKVVSLLEPRVESAVEFALEATLEDLGGFTPGLDWAAAVQQTLELRLFQS